MGFMDFLGDFAERSAPILEQKRQEGLAQQLRKQRRDEMLADVDNQRRYMEEQTVESQKYQAGLAKTARDQELADMLRGEGIAEDREAARYAAGEYELDVRQAGEAEKARLLAEYQNKMLETRGNQPLTETERIEMVARYNDPTLSPMEKYMMVQEQPWLAEAREGFGVEEFPQVPMAGHRPGAIGTSQRTDMFGDVQRSRPQSTEEAEFQRLLQGRGNRPQGLTFEQMMESLNVGK